MQKGAMETVLVGIGTFLSLAVLGVFVYVQMVYEKPMPSDHWEREELLEVSKQDVFIESYKIDKLVVNLLSRTNRLHFLDVEMHLRPFQSHQIDYFKHNKAFIYDTIINTAGNMSPKELNSIYGKTLFEDRIKKRINNHLPHKALREIFFSRFVVQ